MSLAEPLVSGAALSQNKYKAVALIWLLLSDSNYRKELLQTNNSHSENAVCGVACLLSHDDLTAEDTILLFFFGRYCFKPSTPLLFHISWHASQHIFRRTTHFSIVKGSLIYKLPHFIFFKGDELKRIYLFLAALGLHCCAWALPGCGRHGLLSVGSAQASHCSGFPGCGARAPGRAASAAVPHGLSCFMAVESLRTRDQTWRDPCTGS